MLAGWPETRRDAVYMQPGANALAPVARRSANDVKERPPLNIFVTGPGHVRWTHNFSRTGYDEHPKWSTLANKGLCLVQFKTVVTLQMAKIPPIFATPINSPIFMDIHILISVILSMTCAPSLTRIKRWAWSSLSRYHVPSLLPSRRFNPAPFYSHPLGGGGRLSTFMRPPALWFFAPYHSEESKVAKDGHGALSRGILYPLSSP